MSFLSESWFEEAKRLEMDQCLLIQVSDKKEQTAFLNEMKEERAKFAQVEPQIALQFGISPVRKDGRYWVVVSRKRRAPLKGLVKLQDGSYKEVEIDPQRRRMLTLMIKDGIPREEIEELLSGLTDAEEAEFFSE